MVSVSDIQIIAWRVFDGIEPTERNEERLTKEYEVLVEALFMLTCRGFEIRKADNFKETVNPLAVVRPNWFAKLIE